MAAGAGRRHALLLFAVLAGLFLMHGLSSPSMHDMPMTTQIPTPMSVTAMPSPPSATTVDSPDQMPDHMQAGMNCVPLRPEGTAGLLLALFLVVITPWRPGLPHAPRLIHPHWPHGPPRTGVQVLRTLSISRT